MTKAKSGPFDNGMICESCNDPKTQGCSQTKYRLFLGGGLGWGDMWMCDSCLKKAEERDKEMSKSDITRVSKSYVLVGKPKPLEENFLASHESGDKPNPSPIKVRYDFITFVTDSEVRELAHQLWIERGKPEGSPEIDWNEARNRLTGKKQ